MFPEFVCVWTLQEQLQHCFRVHFTRGTVNTVGFLKVKWLAGLYLHIDNKQLINAFQCSKNYFMCNHIIKYDYSYVVYVINHSLTV